MQMAMPRRMQAATLTVVLGVGILLSCKAREGSRHIESTIAKEVKQKITIGGKEWKNPVPDTAESQKQGGEHFQHHCMICHGLDGHNTGVPFAAKMDPPVPDLSSRDVQDYTDGQLKWIIQNGIAPSGMPGWHGILDDGEMWNIVNYVRHLPPKGSLGSPAVYQEAEEEHEHGSEAEKKRPAAKHKHTHKHTH
ncbi:MAG TPA: cytochrome c, partial [Terriglobales bacterium]|nr:cytochrome c [Terriglobales bacterium]